MTLYLKYRPQRLEDLDSEAVRESLTKIVSSGKIPHAFLFLGPKGIGKTSAARILAKIINCESTKKPCNRCEQCLTISKGTNLDVVELDAASNRGIEDVRNLKDAVKLSPARAKKKVYIIDEAHMLTTEAGNALLKTLEEPPEHVMFILATTNPEKLAETIRSRTTNIVFARAKPEELLRSLKKVARGEKIKINDTALSLIAKAGRGSFRDAVKLLELVFLEKVKTDEKSIEEFLFKKKLFSAEGFLEILAKKEVKAAILEVEKVAESGVSMDTFLEEILTRLRQELLAAVGAGEKISSFFTQDELVTLIELFRDASRELGGAYLEQIPVELAILAWCDKRKIEDGNKKLSEEVGSVTKEEPTKDHSNVKPQSQDSIVQSQISTVTDEIWRNILAAVKPKNTSIEALLRAARPVNYDGKVLTLGVFYRFHKERLEEVPNRRILEEVLETIFGSQIRIVCTLTEPPVKKITEEVENKAVLTEGEDKDIIKVAEEIFGN